MCFDPFTMMLVEGSSQIEFLDIYLTTSFKVSKIGNTSAYFFLENVQHLISISKMQKEIPKKIFVSQMIVSELVPLNSLY